jgi:hypothetical protein
MSGVVRHRARGVLVHVVLGGWRSSSGPSRLKQGPIPLGSAILHTSQNKTANPYFLLP